MFETLDVLVGAVVRLRTCPQLPAIDIVLPALRCGHVQDLARKRCCRTCSRASTDKPSSTWTTDEEEEQPSEQNRPPEVGTETYGEAGLPLDAEQTWSHRFLVAWHGWSAVGGNSSQESCIDGVQTESRLLGGAKGVDLRADLAECMAGTVMSQRKKIKTVTWTHQATRFHWPVLFILANMACTSHGLLETW